MDYRWRQMIEADLGAVERIAGVVHPGFFERSEVLAEKQRLYPEGAWLCEIDGESCGYLLSHPWEENSLPALDALLSAIPTDADTYYIHDLALLPYARGMGAAGAVVRSALTHATASGIRTASLVAVRNSQEFWALRGFVVVQALDLATKLSAYEPAARLMRRTLG